MLKRLKLALLGCGLALFSLMLACTAAATPTPAPTATPAPPPPTAAPAPAMQIPPPTMTMLADGVYHYFGFFSSSLVVVGADGVLITDPDNPLRGQSLQEEISKITDQPVTTIALTHEHLDHVGGTGLFPQAQVICHRNCQAHFDLAAPGSDLPEVDQIFDDLLELTVDDTVVQLHYLGPGDGDATTIIYLPAEQIVVTSDLYEPRALTHKNWVDDKNFVGVRHILNTVSQWELKHAVNAHSPGTRPQDLRENVEYYNDLYAAAKTAIDAAIEQGGSPFAAYGLYDTLPETLQLPQYQDWENYDSSFARHVQRMVIGIYHGD